MGKEEVRDRSSTSRGRRRFRNLTPHSLNGKVAPEYTW